MGTNFYINTPEVAQQEFDTMDTEIHIGKRSAAGLYCDKCEVTLCKDGVAGVHHSKSSWHSRCPKCGASKSAKGTRVRCSCSFSWAMRPEEVFKRIQALNKKCCGNCVSCKDHCVVDENGSTFTLPGFLDEVCECDIHYFEHINTEFS